MAEIVRANPHTWTEWVEAHNTVSEGQRLSVDTFHAQAMSYAWGAEDFGSKDRDSSGFSNAYGIAAAEYATEKRTFRPSIPDAYTKWCKGEKF